MRSLCATFAAILLSLSAQAQDAALAHIAEVNAKAGDIEARFEQKKVIGASGRVVKSSGTLYFSDKSFLAMVYDDPSGDLLIINGNSLKMIRGGKTAIYDTSKNTRMRSLKTILLNCIGGTPAVAAKETDTTFRLTEINDGYVVTLEAAEGQTMGYSLITLAYRRSDGMLVQMKMTEATGITTTYVISDITTGASVDSSVYAL